LVLVASYSRFPPRPDGIGQSIDVRFQEGAWPAPMTDMGAKRNDRSWPFADRLLPGRNPGKAEAEQVLQGISSEVATDMGRTKDRFRSAL
jgi:hypothetical protein